MLKFYLKPEVFIFFLGSFQLQGEVFAGRRQVLQLVSHHLRTRKCSLLTSGRPYQLTKTDLMYHIVEPSTSTIDQLFVKISTNHLKLTHHNYFC